MSLPVLSIIAFAIALLISSLTSINVGFISIAFAFVVGAAFAGMSVKEVASGFPSHLFLVLVGVTLLFGQVTLSQCISLGRDRSIAFMTCPNKTNRSKR